MSRPEQTSSSDLGNDVASYLKPKELMNQAIKIARTPYGIVIFNPVPVSLIADLIKFAGGKSTVLAPGIQNYYGESCSLVIASSAAACALWTKEIEDSLTANTSMSETSKWFHGTDTGTSSKFIWHFMTGLGSPRFISIPKDLDDFGRCVRLIRRFPDWKDRLPELAAKYPEWENLVKQWNDLEINYQTYHDHTKKDKEKAELAWKQATDLIKKLSGAQSD